MRHACPADSGFQPTGDDRAKALDLVPLLKEHVKLLQRTIPEHIQIELVCDSGGHLVLADPTRIRQVVTNLTVNARDAMPSGGRLRIGIEHLQITTRTETPLGLTPGPWVRLSVSDTGSGIASDVLPHIFEPFYSTKGPGRAVAWVWHRSTALWDNTRGRST